MSKWVGTMRGRRVVPGKDQRGMILVVTLMMVLMLALLTSAFLMTSGTEHQIAKNDQELIQALFVAEGGLQAVLNSLNLGLTPPTTGTIGPGQFTATVTNAPPPTGQQRLVATGYVPSQASPRAAKKLAMLVTTGSLFQWAGFGKQYVKISNEGFTDSYDSASGPYGGTNVSSHGDARSNGDITLSGSSLVKGDAMAGGTVSNPSNVTGTSTNGAPAWNPLPVACPSGGYTPSVPSGPGITYDANHGDLKVAQGNNITLSSPATYYFHDVSLSGGSTITFTAGGRVNMYVSHKFSGSGGGVVNTSGLPPNLLIWGCGDDTSPWSLTGASGAYYGLYAPNHELNVTGGGNIWGSIITDGISDTGGSSIHFDQDLARILAPGSKLSIVPRSWTELSL